MTRDASRHDDPPGRRRETQDASRHDESQERCHEAHASSSHGDPPGQRHESQRNPRHEPPLRRPMDETPPTPVARVAAPVVSADDAWSDRSIDERLGRLLQFGVLLAGSVVFAGALLYLWRHGHEIVDYSTFRGQPDELRTISGILHSTSTGRARGLIQLGLLLLVATPIARVAFAGYAFLRQRDWLYAGIALFVLVFLFVSLRGGFS